MLQREQTNAGTGFVAFPSLEMFKTPPDMTLSNLLLLGLVCGIEQVICRAAFPPELFCDIGKGKNVPERERDSEIDAAAHQQIPLFQKEKRTAVKCSVFCNHLVLFKVFLCAACLDCYSL